MMAMKPDRHKRPILTQPARPLGPQELERLALFYAGRYASTRAKLRTYLVRKLRERGWEGEGEPPVERLVERFSALGYVDDRAFATARADALGRRGYGARRIGPFAQEVPDPPQREKALGAMLRAGHPLGLARRLVDAPPGEVPDPEE